MSEPARSETDPGPPEPSRRSERAAAGLLLLFAVLTFVVRDHWSPVIRLDESTGARVARWTAAHPVLGEAAWVVSLLGSLPVRTVVIAVLAWFLVTRGHRRGAVFVVLVTLTGTLLNVAVKSLVDRPRPTMPEPLAVAHGLSYPSGHAMAAAVTYALVASAFLFSGVVERAPRRSLATGAVTAAVVVTLLVGASRVLLGVHYVSDVLAGWALGLAWVLLATAVFRPWRPITGAAESNPGRFIPARRDKRHDAAGHPARRWRSRSRSVYGARVPQLRNGSSRDA